MDLDLDSQLEVINVNFKGNAHKVRPLKVREQMDFQVKVKDLEQGSAEYSDKVFETISSCGFPKDELLELTSQQLESLLGALSKKK